MVASRHDALTLIMYECDAETRGLESFDMIWEKGKGEGKGKGKGKGNLT